MVVHAIMPLFMRIYNMEAPMKLTERVSWLMDRLQGTLFPSFEKCYETKLTEHEERLIKILEIVRVEKYVFKKADNQWLGRKLKDREAIARAFVAKKVYKHKHTSLLIDELKRSPNLKRICGFDETSTVPCEATFSRAFSEFAKNCLGERVHDALIEQHLKTQLVGHISRDSTAIEGREKPVKKARTEKKEKAAKKKGRPKKGEVREAGEEKRLDRQLKQSVEDALKELPVVCDVGCKQNSKGYKESWTGYKLHLDVNDCGLPISAVLTSASVHDSQVAIPMIKMTSSKVSYLYDLMDSAYDAGQIYEASRKLDHVPLIDKNRRGGEVVPMAPHEAIRYNERTVAERCNSRLKEDFGARDIMVRGHEKVKQHLMFGIIALFADMLIKLSAN
jgi:hypothetical protein